MKDVILTGMRPTGDLHLGHYVGVIKNMVRLQDEFNCFYFTADWHALTSCYDKLDVINAMRIEYVRGWLASGVDPSKATIYNQSWVPEVLAMNQFFMCLTPPGWADRSPSWKDMKEVNYQQRLDNLGFYSYPILMAVDIAIVRSTLVPVGEDQTTHVEIAREIVRKFNRMYGTDIPEPKPYFTSTPKLMGFGGRKMSSSLGNVISLRESEKSLQKKINKLKTDDTRASIDAPGNPSNCSVYDYHKVFSTPEQCTEICNACQKGCIGCGECKKRLGDAMKIELMPISEKMHKITDQECLDVLKDGSVKAQKYIQGSWGEILDKIGFYKC